MPASGGEQAELSGITSALERLAANGRGDLEVGQLHDAQGEAVRCHTGLGCERLDRRRSGLGIELQLPDEVVLVQAPAIEVRVSDGRLGAAEAIASRTGLRPSRAWPDPQPTLSIQPCDRPSADAHLDDVDRVDLEGEAVQSATDPIQIRRRVFPLLDERHFARGAAHVEHDQVGDAQLGGERPSADDAGDRAGLDRPNREAARHIGGHRATAGVEDDELPLESVLLQASEQTMEISLGDRRDVRVRRDRRKPLVLTPLAAQLGRHGDRHAQRTLDRAGHALLVRRRHVRVQKRHTDGLDIGRPEALDQLGELLLGRPVRHPPAGVRAFGDLEAHVPGDQRRIAPVAELKAVGPG
jgi:hypothetical protein